MQLFRIKVFYSCWLLGANQPMKLLINYTKSQK